MDIEIKKEGDTTKYSDIDLGDFFVHDGKLFCKYSDNIARDLHVPGHSINSSFRESYRVYKVKKLIVEY